MQYDFKKRHLFRLEELEDYEVASEDPDVRGWSIIDKSGEKAGVIKDLIVSPDSLMVRYLDVILDKSVSDKGERHLLIPIGAARVDEVNDVVKVPELDKTVFLSYPEYTGGPITRNYEHDIRETLSKEKKTRTEIPDEDFYKHDLFDEAGFYQARRRKSMITGDRQAIAYTAIRRRYGKGAEKNK